MNERDWKERLAWWMRTHYRVSLDEIEPTSTPGCWRKKERCGGRHGGCREPIHGYFGCENGMHHTVTYYDTNRAPNGRWSSPFETWRKAKAEAGENAGG